MKRLLTVCLLIVLIAVCAPLHALVPAARAAQQTVPDEIKLLRYAQALYDDMIIAHPTAQQYRIYQWNRKEFYRDKLAKAKTYNFTYDYFINISGALIDIGMGFLTGDVGKMVGGVAGMYVDEAYNAMMDKLKLTAPMSVKDYIYAQAESALNAIELGTIENVMERAQNNGGKLVSYADAAELVYAHLKNELHFSTMAMGTGYYDKQLSQGPADAIRDLMVKISLSEIAGKISQNSFTLSTLEGFLLNFEYQFLDGIGQQAHEPCVTQWIKEQKSIMDEFKKFAGGEDVVALRDLTHPSWIDSDAGKWTSVSGEACEMEIKSLDGVSSMQLYFPATGQTETAVFAGIDSRHRAVYLNAEHATVISYSGTGDEINLWINPYDGNSFGGSRQDRSATFIRQEYAWAGHWVNTENPETVLDITSNGDGTLHLDAHFAPDLSFAFDFPPEDYELLYFDTLEQPFPADMRIDGYTGMLEFNIFADLNFGWLNVDTSRYERFAQYAGTYFFTTDNPPDLTRFGWIPYDDPISLSDEETRQLFSRLSETPLMAASGAGAWEGRLKVNPDGTFSGYYYDADFDTVYEVSFSGHFSSSVEFDGNAYWLWVEEVTTAQTPGDTAQSEYGDTIIYDEPLFYGGEYLLLTLPGTPNNFIPEEVQGEIGGVYGEWEDYSRFITLTRLDDGWGFFADPNDPPAYDLEPIPVAGEEELELNWTGIWVNKQDANSRLYAYQQAGSGGEEYQTIQTMERSGRAVAFQGGFYPVDEITVEYYSEGLLHSGVVQDPVGHSLSLTVFSALDDAMLPWVACLEGDYEYIGPLDDPDSQIPASVWELARNGLKEISQPAPTAAPVATPPMEGRVLIDDDLWTLSLLGKEQKYGPGYILRMRNNSGRDLSVYVNAQVWFHEPLSIAFQGRDDLSIYETLIGELPAGADITRDLLFSMKDLDIRTTDDLNMTDIWFSLSEGHGGAFREYENVLLDWDPAVTAESLFTPLCTITPQELSGDPSLVSVRALGTYQFVTGRAGILCRVTNNSSMQMNVGGYNVAFGGNFTFAPEVNSQRCSNVIGEMRKSDGSLKRGWLEPGESAHLFFSFTVDGKEVTTISSASILLDLYTPAQEKGKSITLGRYICNLSFTPVAASTATPVPTATPTPSDKLPKHVSRLPNGNLRYDDGLIAFEFPDSFGLTVNGRFTNYDGRVFQSGCTLYKENAAQPIIISYGVEEVPDGESAEEQAWAKKSKSTWGIESYEVVAGHTAKCIYYPPATGSGLGSFSYYIPLSGNRLLEMNVFNQSDEELINARNLFMDTLEIRDSLFAEPPAGPVQTESPAPTPAPTATPDLSAWTGHWMTYAEDMAEMIITNNGNGTLHAKALFLPAGDHEATLTPQGDGSMRFESQYGHLIGSLIRQADGGLRLTFTGGTTMEDEEATEYQGYFAQGFTYYPATYADMWYQTPEDAAATEDDWLGYWTAMNGDGVSALQISRMNGQLMVDVTLGRYHFSGPADTGSDSIMAVYDDDFCCLLLLNNKLNKIAMLEVDTSIEEVYDITGNPYYGVLIFQKTPDINTYLTPDQIDALLNAEVPPTLIMPVPTQAPQNIALLPIPGKAGCMQVPISRADATSYIVGSKDPTAYAPFRMIDGEETTSFQFSTKTTPLGQAYLYFDFDGPVTLDELWMKNGFWKITDGKDQYTRNSRVKKMTIFVRFAGSGDYQLLKDVSLKDDSARKDWKVIDMLGVQNVTGVRIRIDEIFKGSKFPTDVCISEIMFVQRAN